MEGTRALGIVELPYPSWTVCHSAFDLREKKHQLYLIYSYF